ncbi:tetratricopeptide repeat protein, partial [Streptomyces sp. NPDC050844]|uniref:tetratricopeptide repeat protein n=1 Tax=Streptomyces sp. NPDC050844 TaxID=3155790 RepID=UPI0033CFEF83
MGNSSVGKTRLLYESACAELAGFTVLAPDPGNGGLVNRIADSTLRLQPLIVWLDELQRFLPGPYFVTGQQSDHAPLSITAVRKLLSADTPVVILSTLWPEHIDVLHEFEPIPGTLHQRPRYPTALEILNANGVSMIGLESFSSTERTRAVSIAVADPRLAQAMADPNYNLTEALAGTPQTMRRYQQATELHKAVIHVAVDARRHGFQAPLTAELLRDAALGYIDRVQPNDTWFEQVLAELASSTRSDDRATAPLIPLPTYDRRGVLGYTVADYLVQHLIRQRRSRRMSPITWQALIDHTTGSGDRLRLAVSAQRRLLYGTAEALYRPLIALDDAAAFALARQLTGQSRVDEAAGVLREAAVSGSLPAASRLARLLSARGNLEEAAEVLRTRVSAGDPDAATKLAEVLSAQGRIDEAAEVLRTRADAGDREASTALATLLAGQESSDRMRLRASAGNLFAAMEHARLLASHGRVDELRAATAAGDFYAGGELARLFAAHGRVDDAIDVLRLCIDAGDSDAATRLAKLLSDNERVDEAVTVLRSRLNAGDPDAATKLADFLSANGRLDEAVTVLRSRLNAGDPDA